MPIITPDLSEALDNSPIEPGTYPAKIAAVDVETSKKGNPMVVATFKVTVDGKEKTRKSYLVITGAGAAGFGQLLRATGFSDIADMYADPDVPNPPFDTDNLIGQEVQVVISHSLYQGQVRDQIDSYLPQ